MILAGSVGINLSNSRYIGRVEESKNWDFMIVNRGGNRAGFRVPLRSARRLVLFFSVILLLFAFSFTGWLFSRWQAIRLSQELQLERMKAEGLEASLEELRKRQGGASVAIDSSALETYTLLPSLDAGELSSSLVEIKDDSVTYDSAAEEVSLNFDIERRAPRDGTARFYWFGLLHGPQGILSFPPVLASRNGDPVLFHRGEALDDVKIHKSVTARYQIRDFVKKAGNEPMFFTLLLYDNKGSLLVRKRYELQGRRNSAEAQQ